MAGCMRASGGRVVSVGECDTGSFSSTTGMLADPFVALSGWIEAIGGEGVAVGADGAAHVVIAANRPEGLVLIGGMSAEVDESPSMEVMEDGMQEGVIAEGGISGHSVDVEGGEMAMELAQESSGGLILV